MTKRVNSEVAGEEGLDDLGHLSGLGVQKPDSAREIASVPQSLVHAGRPRLIVLEGPAGVGKTTLLGPLVEAFRLRGVPARSLPEFSLSPLGESLQRAADLETDRADQWCQGLAGLLAFVSDRVAKLETALADPGTVHVCDRFLCSEALLVQATIEHELDQKTGSAILAALFEWAAARFSKDSLVLMLSSRTADKRIRQRLGGRMGEHVIARLRNEQQAYARLVGAGVPWTIRRVSTDRQPERVAQMLATWICGKWRL